MGCSGNASNCTRLQKSLFLILLICGIVLIAAISVLVLKTDESGADSDFESNLYSRDEVAFTISSSHYKEPDYEEVYKHTNSIRDLNAYLKTLDPYSKYSTSEEVIFLEKRNRKNRVGVGLDLLVKGEQIFGVPVMQGPAYKAGLVQPAYVRAINDRKIVYSDFSSYSFLGELSAGEVARVSLENNKNLDKTVYTIKAGNHATDPITYSTHKDTLFILIKKFIGGENSQLKRILDSSQEYKKLVLDLRYCPGGDLYAMVDMLSLILQDDLAVAYLEKADGKVELILKTLPGRVIANTPLYILVSEFTASTAELFVWALKANHPKVRVLGEPTKGKCLAQNMFGFHDGSALKLTTYEVKNSFNESCQGHPLVVDTLIPGVVLANTQEILNALADIGSHAVETPAGWQR